MKTRKEGLSELSCRFLDAISSIGVSGYKLKKEGIISSESTLTNIKRGTQQPSRKTIDALCDKYPVNKSWIYTGEDTSMRNEIEYIKPEIEEELMSDIQPQSFFSDTETEKNDYVNDTDSSILVKTIAQLDKENTMLKSKHAADIARKDSIIESLKREIAKWKAVALSSRGNDNLA